MAIPLARALGASMAAVLSSKAPTLTGTASRVNLPASILDRSRMALMISSKCRPAASIRSSLPACAGVRPERRRRCVMPLMAWSGVRISWLMLARKALFAMFAVSAASLAWRNSCVRTSTRCSRCRRCCANSSWVALMAEISVCVPHMRSGLPSASRSITLAWSRIQTRLPSLRNMRYSSRCMLDWPASTAAIESQARARSSGTMKSVHCCVVCWISSWL